MKLNAEDLASLHQDKTIGSIAPIAFNATVQGHGKFVGELD